MNKLRQSDWGWIGLVGGVVAYEVLCKPGETLSEGYDRYMSTRLGKVACMAVTTFMSAHLLNLIPDDKDPLVGTLAWKIPKQEGVY